MQIPKLSGVEFLIEEGRLPGLLFSGGAFLGVCALIIALFLFADDRTAIISYLTNNIDVLAVVGAGISAWKTWTSRGKNGNGKANGNNITLAPTLPSEATQLAQVGAQASQN